MLTPEEVQHIAQLARVGMTAGEVERLRLQLSQILDHFETLRGADTQGVEPTAFAVQLQNVMRDDVARPSDPVEEVLANAPDQEDQHFRVRAILET